MEKKNQPKGLKRNKKESRAGGENEGRQGKPEEGPKEGREGVGLGWQKRDRHRCGTIGACHRREAKGADRERRGKKGETTQGGRFKAQKKNLGVTGGMVRRERGRG